MIDKLIDNVTSNTTGDSVNPKRIPEREYGVLQVEITDTGSAVLQGRLGADAPWHDVETFNDSGIKVVRLFPFMRVDVTVSAGSVNAWLEY